jgi:hypothetical protein
MEKYTSSNGCHPERKENFFATLAFPWRPLRSKALNRKGRKETPRRARGKQVQSRQASGRRKNFFATLAFPWRPSRSKALNRKGRKGTPRRARRKQQSRRTSVSWLVRRNVGVPRLALTAPDRLKTALGMTREKFTDGLLESFLPKFSALPFVRLATTLACTCNRNSSGRWSRIDVRATLARALSERKCSPPRREPH